MPLSPYAWGDGGGAPNPGVGGLPAGYPRTAAALRAQMLQGVLYPERFIVRAMRIAWRAANDAAFVEADLLGNNAGTSAAAGETTGVQWTTAERQVRIAIWIAGATQPFALTHQLNVASWDREDMLARVWAASAPLRVGGVDGLLFVSTNRRRVTANAQNIARALMDPGAPNF